MSGSAGARGSGADWRQFARARTPIRETVITHVVVPLVFGLLCWAGWALVGWLAWLHWPVVVVNAVLLGLFLSVVFNTARMQVKRVDTATQTLRAASQGQIEVIGTISPIGALRASPLYGVPCVAFKSWLTAYPATGKPFRLEETWLPPAVILTDGSREAFLPVHAGDEPDMHAVLHTPQAPRDLLREDVRENVGSDWRITERREHVIPPDAPMQVNAVFRTVSSHDSYRATVNAHVGLPPPTAEALETCPVEAAWRTYCRHRETIAGTAGPVAVDAFLPVTLYKDIGIVRVADSRWLYALDQMVTVLLASLPLFYLLLRLLGVIDPLPFLF